MYATTNQPKIAYNVIKTETTNGELRNCEAVCLFCNVLSYENFVHK